MIKFAFDFTFFVIKQIKRYIINEEYVNMISNLINRKVFIDGRK